MNAAKTIMTGRLVRAVAPDTPAVRILIDGEGVTAYAGESVLVAVSVDADHVVQFVCKHPDRSSVRSKGPMTPV